MNSSSSRQLFVWSVPTVAIVLSILWYRKRLRRLQTDPGGTKAAVAEKQQLVTLENQEEDAEELRIVQQEYKRLLAEGLPDKVPEIEPQVIEQQVTEPKESRREVAEEAPLVAQQQQKLETAPPLEKKEISSWACSAPSKEAHAVSSPKKESKEDEKPKVAKSQQKVVEDPCTSPKKGNNMKAKMTAAPVEQQTVADELVEQITEITSKISIDVQQTQPQPRDSANNSPAEAMLASPTISHDSDSHSVVSFHTDHVII